MWISVSRKILFVWAVCSVSMIYSPFVSADGNAPNWWKTQEEVSGILLTQGTSISDLVSTVEMSKPENAQDAMFKSCVLMRAGMKKEAIRALHELHTICPDLDDYQIEGIYYFACDDLAAWDIAQATVEIFAENIAEMALENRLIKYFLNSGWAAEKVDTWLAGMPAGPDGFWIKQRMRFNNIHDLGDGLITELTENIKRKPDDMDAVILFLDGLIFSRHTGEEQWDLSWMIESIHPTLAMDSEKIAARLKTLKEWEAAVPFYERAMHTPLTSEETEKLAIMCSIFVPDKRLRAMFSVRVREGLAECLLETGNTDEAQDWMVEAADIREEHNLGLNALFSGMVQRQSGQRVIEGRIKDEEEKSEDDPRYWRDRAQYYRGRKESAQEEEAILKGLALTSSFHDTISERTGSVDLRGWLLSDYAHFLEREERTDEAISVLREELELAPATSQSSRKAAHLLAFDFYKEIGVDDSLLWNWLANQPTWEYTEERLLWRMLEHADVDILPIYYDRAEEMVFGNDPSRSQTLGWIMNRMRSPERSIPLLKYAIEHAQDKEFIEKTQFTLFESYLDLNEWRRAEDLFPEASKRLTPKEIPDWYARIAISAAHSGAKEDAFRIWKRVANISPSWLRGLKELRDAGLKDDLIVFYERMQSEMPESELPGKALEELRGRAGTPG